MDEKEAGYAIDQFNKYASWAISQPLQLQSSASAFIVACCAFMVAIYGVYFRDVTSVPPSNRTEIIVFFSVLIICPILLVAYSTFKAIREQRRNMRKLVSLMDYYLKEKTLPEGLTFEQIADPARELPNLRTSKLDHELEIVSSEATAKDHSDKKRPRCHETSEGH